MLKNWSINMLSAFEARKLIKPNKYLGSPLVTEEAASTVDNFMEFIENNVREACANSHPNMHFTVNVDSFLSPVIYDRAMNKLQENGYAVRDYGRGKRDKWSFEVMWGSDLPWYSVLEH